MHRAALLSYRLRVAAPCGCSARHSDSLRPAMQSLIAFLTPYELYPSAVLSCALAALLYLRGLVRRRHDGQSTAPWRTLSFSLGLVLIYLMFQSRLDYLSQHMFFVHRAQHLVLHHLGPLLVLLAAPLEVMASGMPHAARRLLLPLWRNPLTRTLYGSVQQPVVACVLFVGLIYFWLTPEIHFDAMLNVQHYLLMNWSMLIDGLLFWWLVLDPRAPGRGGLGYGYRSVMLWVIVPPQIVIGAHIALSPSVLYDVYDVCGRAWPMSPLLDQQIAGLLTWIPASMMSVVAQLIVLRRWLRDSAHEPSPQPVTGS